MLNIICGVFGSDIRGSVINEITAKAKAGTKSLLIVPEHCSHEAERLLCEKGGDAISLYAEVLNFRQLAGRIFGEVGGLANKAVDDGGRILAMKSAVDSAKSVLKVYDNAAQKIGFISNLIELIAELKEENISCEDLARLAALSNGRTADKLSDIAYIYSAYINKIAEGQYDPEDINKLAASKIAQSETVKASDIYLDGFSGFTPQQLMIIKEMLQVTEQVTATMMFDTDNMSEDDIPEEFYKESVTIKKLIGIAKETHNTVKLRHTEDVCAASDTPQAFIAENLFKFTTKSYSRESGYASFYAAQNIFAECEFVAASIKRLVRSEHIRYKNITVTARQMENYAETLSAVFKYYDIPIFVSKPQSILKRPIFSYIANCLEAVKDFNTGAVIRAIKSEFSGIDAGDADILEVYANLWNISKSKWLKSGSLTANPSGYSEKMTASDSEKLEKINKIKDSAVAPLIALKAGFEKSENGGQYVKALYNFILAQNLHEKIKTKAEELALNGELRLSEEYVQLWDIFVGALEQFYAVSGESLMTVESFTELFTLVLSAYDVDTIPVSVDAVRAVGMERIGYISEKYLFVLGAGADSLPLPHKITGILTAADREMLSNNGIDISKTSLQLSMCESGIIYKALTSAEKMLVCTYPMNTASGAENKPSAVMLRLSGLFGKQICRINPADIAVERPDTLYDKVCFYAKTGDTHSLENLIAKIPQYADALAVIRQRYDEFTRRKNNPLGTDKAAKLYGDTVNLSPSQIEVFHTCRFYYFMKYGLRAQKNRVSIFNSADTGNFIHYILEHSIKELSKNNFADEGVVPSVVKHYTQMYIDDVIGGLEDKTSRFKHLLGRLSEGAEYITSDVAGELKCSDFVPLDFELRFSEAGGGIAPYSVSTDYGVAEIGGKADRVDGYIKGNELYVRVSDYKTGAKHFELSDIKNGLNLQMLIYLFAIEKNGVRYYNSKLNRADLRRIVPSGVLYAHAKEPLLKVPSDITDEEYTKELKKQSRRFGIIAGDDEIIEAMEKGDKSEHCYLPVSYNKSGEFSGTSSVCSYEDFHAISKYIENIIKKMICKIKRGEISVNPYISGKDDMPCRYCDYRSACIFDSDLDGERARHIYKIKRTEFMNEIYAQNERDEESNGK